MRRTLADSGRFPMAWLSRPCFRGDLFLCTDVLPQWYFRPVYETEYEPAMRCIGPLRGRNAVCRCSLPCVGQVDGGTTRCFALARAAGRDRPLKPGLQKRLKKRTDCGGKHLGCSWEANQGLQCGLSGNRVPVSATSRSGHERETASSATGGCPDGKQTRPKP